MADHSNHQNDHHNEGAVPEPSNEKKGKQFSIKNKLLLVCLPIMAFAYVLFFTLIENRYYNTERISLIEDGNKLLNLQIPAFETALWGFDGERILTLMDGLKLIPYIDGAILRGLGGETLQQIGEITPEQETNFTLTAPLHYVSDQGRELIGNLQIQLHDRTILEQIYSRTILYGWGIVGFTILAWLLINFSANRMIFDKITSLQKDMELSQSRQRLSIFKAGHSDEIGELVMAYNNLQRKRFETIKAMQEQAFELKAASLRAEEEREAAEQARSSVRQKMEEIERFNALVVGRETRISEMKQLINNLSIELGRDTPFEDPNKENSDTNTLFATQKEKETNPNSQQVPDEIKKELKPEDITDQYIFKTLRVTEDNNLITGLVASIGIPLALLNMDGKVLRAPLPETGLERYKDDGVFSDKNSNFSHSEEMITDKLSYPITINYDKHGLCDVGIPLYRHGQQIAWIFFGRLFITDDKMNNKKQEKISELIKTIPYEISLMSHDTMLNIAVFVSDLFRLIVALSKAQDIAIESNHFSNLQREAALSLAEDANIARKELADYQLPLQKLIEQRTHSLEETTSLLKVALDNMSDGIFLLDSKMNFVLYNKRYIDLMQVPEGLVSQGNSIEHIIRYAVERGDFETDDVDAWVHSRIRQLRENPFSVATYYVVDGPIVEITATQTSDGGVVGVASDQTQRKLAEKALAESEERSRTILDTVAEGILGIDLKGHITFVNKSACVLLGYDNHELLGHSMHSLINHSNADGEPIDYENSRICKVLTKGEEQQHEDEVLWHKDGTNFPVAFFCHPLHKDNNLTGAVYTFQNITDQLKAQTELNDKINELETFSKLSIGRELKMVKYKQEINDFSKQLGEPERYKIANEDYLA